MSHTTDLLDAYKHALGLRTDMAAAEALGITRGAVSAWRSDTNRRHAEPESVETMAKACGLDPEEWVLRVQADREAQVNPRRAQVWVRCANRLAKTAAAIILMLAFGRLDVYASPAPGVHSFAHNSGTLSIMSNLTRWARSLHAAAVALLARLHGGAQHGPSPAAA